MKQFLILFIFVLIPFVIPSVSASCPTEFLEPDEPCIDTFGKLITNDPPLKQIKNGIALDDVTCNDGFHKFFKLSNGMPVCIFPHSIETLIQRDYMIFLY